MNKGMGFGVGLLVGAAIGGAVALLYAPKKGEETRQIIKDKAAGTVETVKERTGQVIGAFKGATTEVGNKGRATIQALRS
jgi:gas vesicle protein